MAWKVAACLAMFLSADCGGASGPAAASPKTDCERAALRSVKSNPELGRVLVRGEDMPELGRLEAAHGKGRWCRVVFRKIDDCAQTCALVQYYWEKKSNKVADVTFERSFEPKPCDAARQRQSQQQQQQQQQRQRQQQQQTGQKPSQATGTAPEDDYYHILGVKRDATAQDIKKAYRKLAMRWHPDKNQGEQREEAEEMFKRISEAYQVVSDDEKRKQYDTFGKAGPTGGGGGGFQGNFDPRDMFRTFFTQEEGQGESFFKEFFGGGPGGSTMHFTFTTSGAGPSGQRRSARASTGGPGAGADFGNMFGGNMFGGGGPGGGAAFGGAGGDPFGGFANFFGGGSGGPFGGQGKSKRNRRG